MTTPTATAASPVFLLRGELRGSIGWAAALVGVLAVTGVAVCVNSFHVVESTPGGGVFALTGSTTEVFLTILGRNLGAGLLLFSGYATFGTTTVLGLLFISSWVGSGSAAIAAETGLAEVDPWVLTYLPFEFAGLLGIAVGGLLPISSMVRRSARDSPSPRAPVTRSALLLLAAGSLSILVGAVLETALIHHHVNQGIRP